ncbi:vesicular-fusion protein SEC17 [Gymnopilus junonius]|uniref:Vesicular-fusion protein SEC17 n=1 Tax=Gymnopilus junonius TaxID=109634 RepID=A0A9P5NV22_GYMJU|nr:vesicular-fusion protein SEC17 [Gymnopilus junonius]
MTGYLCHTPSTSTSTMPSKSPAQVLLEKADKKANSSGGWFTSSSTKYEEAGDLYQQAANSFKLEKLFKEAGDCFAREAECRELCKEENEASNAWWNAAKAYKRGYPDLAIQALTQTVVHLTKGGRFRQAADREKEIGQIYLQESNNLQKACESFERAGDWYQQEDAAATANACFKDAADLHAELENYPQAIARYEQVADQSLTSALTKYSVKEYWLRASLCALALGDTVTAKRNMQKYCNQDVTFSSTREAKFINVLIEAVEGGDAEAFTAAVFEFDQVTKLDNWKTNILLKIKRSFQEEVTLV